MLNSKKVFSLIIAITFILGTLLSYIPVNALQVPALPKAVISGVQYKPGSLEGYYKLGAPVSLTIKSTGYTKNVQYRVLFYNYLTKKTIDVTKGYTKKSYKPNTPFIVKFTPKETGYFGVFVMAKRAGYLGYYKTYDSSTSWTLTVNKDENYSKEGTYNFGGKNIYGDITVSGSKIIYNNAKIFGNLTVSGSNSSIRSTNVSKNINITGNDVTYLNSVVTGDLSVTGNNASISNVTVNGTLILDPGAEGNASLNNVTASKIEVRSGGQNSIRFNNVQSNLLDVKNKNNTPVRIEISGNTLINQTATNTYVIFDSKSGSFGTITVNRNEQGQVTVELRGTFTQPIIVDGSATIRAAEGAVIPELRIAATQTTDTVVLQGSFTAVNVTSQANIQVAAGSTIQSINATANANITVEKGAVVQKLETNGNKVVVGGEGTVNQGGTTPTTPPIGGGGSTGGGGGTGPTYNENTNLNSAINGLIGNLKGYELPKRILEINQLASNGQNNNVSVTVNDLYKNLTFDQIYTFTRDRILARGKLLDSSNANYLKDVNTLDSIKTFNKNIKVSALGFTDVTLNEYMAAKLISANKPTLANFFESTDTTKTAELYNAVYDRINSTDYDEHHEAEEAFLAMLPNNDVTIDKIKIYDLTVNKISVVKDNVPNVDVYGGNGDKTISLAEIKTALGIDVSPLSLCNQKPAELLSGKKIVITLSGRYTYTYTIQFN